MLILKSQLCNDEVAGLDSQKVAARTQENGGGHERVVCDGKTNPFSKQLCLMVAWTVEQAAVVDREWYDYMNVCARPGDVSAKAWGEEAVGLEAWHTVI